MSLPRVAIIGRPNVGKSSLFNALAGRRIAIEDPNAGITRDRVSAEADLGRPSGTPPGCRVELIDTGGMGIVDADNLAAQVEHQISIAMNEADLILFVVDVRDGVTPLDKEVAERLRKLGKPTVLLANKADTPKLSYGTGEFGALGMGEALPVSAKEKIGLAQLRDIVREALGAFEAPPEAPAAEAPIKIAVVGKRNAGKSTLVNYLAGEARVIVSDVPGTTRDSVDVPFEFDGRRYVAIDTAGLRRKQSVKASVDFLSIHRTERSIRRSDVTILLLDCTTKLGVVDKRLIFYVVAENKPVIIAINKYDLARDVETDRFRRYIEARVSGLSFAPMVFISAATGFNVKGLLSLVRQLRAQSLYRTTTGELNRIVQDIYSTRRPRAAGRRLPRIYYATQTGVAPPTIVLFVSNPKAFDSNCLRYVENSLRKSLPCAEVPIKIVLRSSGGRDRPEPRGLRGSARNTGRRGRQRK